MADSHDLSKLNPEAFENIVNFLALKTLGLGATGFGPGPDGGRDGYFEGEAPYPSETKRWKGVWYIQSKFHKPHLSTNPQKWLIAQVKKEIEAFESEESDRNWPNNWIIATNIDQSGKPETGSFDAIKKLVNGKKVNVHVWGGRKILDLLALHGDVANYYGHFLTPGHVISALYTELTESRASIEEVIRYFVVTQFSDNMFTKLDQAGSTSDVRPKVHDLFMDLPFHTIPKQGSGEILAELCSAAAQCHRYKLRNQFPESWRTWNRHSKRARVVLIKGGPGQGKSTVSQYLCQIHRAALILAGDSLNVIDSVRDAANAVHNAAERDNFWPTLPRIPIQIELKEFAHWYSQRPTDKPKIILTYLSELVAKKIGGNVLEKTLKNALSKQSWIVVFDGLDEVPNDFKDEVAAEVMYFLNDFLIEIDADVLALCTSRPQGYSGQFIGIDGPVVELSLLEADAAMRCAEPVLKFGRTEEESGKSVETLKTAMNSPNIRELMTTPLQSHIMAVVVRDGGRPPERRWKLFNDFYQVMKKRESLKDYKNLRIARLLREEEKLLKSVHMRLGFVLHARAERSEGAQTALTKNEFRSLVHHVVTDLDDHNIEQTVTDVMEAITERLVLVSTPENGEQVRFDIRQLQEFFAAEFLYANVDANVLKERIEIIGGDAHWREVMHFLMSALIENQRTSEVAVAVQTLCQLNDGDEVSSDKLYRRRMATASLLACRLLSEGVLEQDKGERQKLKPLFDPIGGIFDLSILNGLRHISPPKSRQWLIEFLLDKIESVNPREYVGALFLLGYLLPNDHDKSVLVTRAFFNTPIEWQEYIFEYWITCEEDIHSRIRYRHLKDKTIYSQWVFDIAINILNSACYSQYSQDSLNRLLEVCRTSKNSFLISCASKTIDNKVSNAIFMCLELKDAEFFQPTEFEEIVDCGVIHASKYSENWINGKTPKSLINLDPEISLARTQGLFRLILSCLRFSKERSGPTLKKLVSLFDQGGTKIAAVIPHALLALTPIEGEYSINPYSVDHLRFIDTENKNWLIDLAKNQQCQSHFRQLTLQDSESTDEKWKLLAEYFPRIAINLSLNPEIFRSTNIKPIFVPELISLFKNMPDEVVRHFLKWGAFQETHPDLLHSFKAYAKNLSPKKMELRFPLHNKIHPFKLQLPNDINLLAFLAPPLIVYMDNDNNFLFRSDPSSNEEKSINAILASYDLTSSQLRLIAETNTHNQTIRAGALSLFWLLQNEIEGNLDLVREKELYLELVNDINEAWLTKALVQSILIHNVCTSKDALALVTCIMERCNNGKGPLNELIELIGNWRERSIAPVYSRQVFKKWLGCDSDLPTYAIGFDK